MKNKDFFEKNKYCVVKNSVPEILCKFIEQASLFDEQQNFSCEPSDQAQVPGMHSQYGNSIMEAYLLFNHNIMEENTGLTLYPTYSYYRVYRNGSYLKAHKDRPSCEISSTICFGYNYNPEEFSWPIYMNSNKIIQTIGDMVIYRGCELEHWREKFTFEKDPNVWHIQGFFHYVDVNGPYAEFKYDKRRSIGEKNIKQIQRESNKSYIIYLD